MRATDTRLADRARHRLALWHERPILILMLCLAGTIAGVLWHQARTHDKAVRSTILQEAAGRMAVLEEFRTLYTSEVVSRVAGHGIEITHDYVEKEGAIPLPATLSMLLGERISATSGGGTARLYSPYPFPWREGTGGFLDDFERAAWEQIVKDPDRPFFRFEETVNGPILRYASADRMRQSCIGCHNNHPETPKRDWVVGDVRGVLEVGVPVTGGGSTSLANSLPLLALLGVLGLASIWSVTTRLRRESALLEGRVEERTAELQSENEQRREAQEQRREAEERSRQVLQYAADPIVVIDAAGTVLNASDSVDPVFGWASEDLVGQNISVLMPEPHRSQHDEYLRSHLATGETRVLGTASRLEGQRKDGTVFPVELVASRVVSAPTPTFVGVLRDLSSRLLLEEELEGARRLESIGQLAAGIAHEINTPTQYVGDNTRFLEESFLELIPVLKKAEELADAVRSGTGSAEFADEVKAALGEADVDYLVKEIPRALEQSLNGIDRVRRIVQSMKEFSHPGVEGMTSIDLHRAIETTITVATSEWRYVAEVETDFDRDLPPVPCLPGEINQVILNLIINAAHAIADVMDDGEEGGGGKGTITISTRRDGDFVELRIADTGSGIPQEARGKVFEPFFTTKEVGKGTGQGLHIAHGVVVKKHGGTIDFETEIGKGTTFIIRLPLTSQDVEECVG